MSNVLVAAISPLLQQPVVNNRKKVIAQPSETTLTKGLTDGICQFLLDVSTQARIIVSNEKLQKLAPLNTLGLAEKSYLVNYHCMQ